MYDFFSNDSGFAIPLNEDGDRRTMEANWLQFGKELAEFDGANVDISVGVSVFDTAPRMWAITAADGDNSTLSIALWDVKLSHPIIGATLPVLESTEFHDVMLMMAEIASHIQTDYMREFLGKHGFDPVRFSSDAEGILDDLQTVRLIEAKFYLCEAQDLLSDPEHVAQMDDDVRDASFALLRVLARQIDEIINIVATSATANAEKFADTVEMGLIADTIDSVLTDEAIEKFFSEQEDK